MSATTTNQRLQRWVDEWAEVMKPDSVHWCDGSAEEYDRLAAELVESGTFTRLDEAKRPTSYWAHSDPGDVARVEDPPSSARPPPRKRAPTTTGATPTRCAPTC
jgi:phosphoenolpyruvate carboxykinase (GTP)